MPTQLTSRHILLLLACMAFGLSASGFVLEYGFGVIPCKMCWWQRYAHWAILALSLLGAAHPKLQRPALMAILSAALTGLGIAAWQFAAQHGWLPFPASCTSDAAQAFSSAEDLLSNLNRVKIVPCDKETFTLLGLSLAGWNIPAMLAVLGLSGLALRRPS